MRSIEKRCAVTEVAADQASLVAILGGAIKGFIIASILASVAVGYLLSRMEDKN
jgi:hypothetical protein